MNTLKWLKLGLFSFLILSFMRLQAVDLNSPKTPPPAVKSDSKFNTQIYEKDSSVETFSAVVKVVRQIQGETQILFEGKQGFYNLKDENFQYKFVKAFEEKKAIQVKVDSDTKTILHVEGK